MIIRLDHVGFATGDADRLSGLMRTLGLECTDDGRADDYGVACAFFSTGADRSATAVELVSPTREDSAVATRLARGGGLYHLALEVDDLSAEHARLHAAGLVPIDRTPCAGARPGMRVAFLYAPHPADLLVELVSYSTEEKANAA